MQASKARWDPRLSRPPRCDLLNTIRRMGYYYDTATSVGKGGRGIKGRSYSYYLIVAVKQLGWCMTALNQPVKSYMSEASVVIFTIGSLYLQILYHHRLCPILLRSSSKLLRQRRCHGVLLCPVPLSKDSRDLFALRRSDHCTRDLLPQLS